VALIRPSLSELIEAIRADGDALLGGIDARLERGLVDVLLTAQAGSLHGAYGFLQQIADDAFPDTATSDALERWAGIFGISRGPASFAAGWVGASGATPAGTIPTGTVLRRADGREFERVEVALRVDGTTIDTGAAGALVDWSSIGLAGTGWAVPVQAVESGADGNTANGTSLSFVSPLVDIPPTVTVQIPLAGAVDFETDAALRARLLQRIQNPPQGGTASDYERWALDASTADDPITRVFIVPPASGDNLVTAYVVDDGGGIPANNPPAPSAQAITNANQAIGARKPLSSRISTSAPTFVGLGLTISLSPDTPEGRTSIENELDAFLIDNAVVGQEMPLSLVQAAVSLGAGGADAVVTVPAVNWTPAPGELLYRDAITWV